MLILHMWTGGSAYHKLGLQKEVYMHGINVRVQIQPGKVGEAAKLLREEVMPTAANY